MKKRILILAAALMLTSCAKGFTPLNKTERDKNDELFNGLDKDGVKDMREYLLSYKEQGKTILICSYSA